MAMVITRTVVVPVWLLACALVFMLAPSATAATGLLLFSCGLILAATLLGRTTVHPLPLAADTLATIDVRPLSVTAVARPAVRPWPDSGFRNIGRGTKGG
jgi:hypothetical protein